MQSSRERLFLFLFILIFLLVITLPYLYAWKAGGKTQVFGGFFLNPIDGNSYLAKMRQGYSGEWGFTLPYSYDAGDRAYINMFYILAGHLARLAGWSLIFTFHLLRVIGAGLLLLVLYLLSQQVFQEQSQQRLAFILAAYGSGLGWAVLAFGLITSDMWVAEGFPFLAGFSNPHFPIGMALQLWLLIALSKTEVRWDVYLKVGLASLALALISPFGLIVVGAVGIGMMLLRIIGRLRWSPLLIQLVILAIFSVPLLVYYYWISKHHPALTIWNAQNVTCSPPWWDLLISFSPAMILAILSLKWVIKHDHPVRKMLALWLVVGVILIYLPFSIQRRFMHGLYIPAVFLAVYYLKKKIAVKEHLSRVLSGGLVVLSLVGSLVILLMSMNGASTLSPQLYLKQDEYQALLWLDKNLPQDSIVLAGTDSGLFLPAYSRVRVLYGHPFETVYAERMKTLVQEVYSGKMSFAELTAEYPIDYVYYGPREQALGQPNWLDQLKEIYSTGEVTIYKAKP